MLGDDVFQGAPVLIDVDHHEIHCGDSFMATRTVDLGNGAIDTTIITVPNEPGTGQTQKKYHMVMNISVEVEASIELYEGATTDADGTTIPQYNRDRNSAFVTGLVITHTPTTPAGGTLIQAKQLGSGKSSGGESRGQNEIILKNNTKYRLVVTNATTKNNYVSYELNHYIHPGV